MQESKQADKDILNKEIAFLKGRIQTHLQFKEWLTQNIARNDEDVADMTAILKDKESRLKSLGGKKRVLKKTPK